MNLKDLKKAVDDLEVSILSKEKIKNDEQRRENFTDRLIVTGHNIKSDLDLNNEYHNIPQSKDIESFFYDMVPIVMDGLMSFKSGEFSEALTCLSHALDAVDMAKGVEEAFWRKELYDMICKALHFGEMVETVAFGGEFDI
jgi:hypothetical protein